MNCPKCNSKTIKRNGHQKELIQNYRCNDCGRQFTTNRLNGFYTRPSGLKISLKEAI